MYILCSSNVPLMTKLHKPKRNAKDRVQPKIVNNP